MAHDHFDGRPTILVAAPYNAPVSSSTLRVGLGACACLAVAASFLTPGAAQDRPKVRVGYCTTVKNLDAAKAAGFDYVELAATEIAGLSDADFAAAAAHIKQLGLATPAANLFLPATLKVTGPSTDPEQQMAHVRRVFSRLSTLGTEVVVFGSGGARRVPDGFAKEDAVKQLVDFGRRAAREARASGITIAIEPLRRQETNIINTAAEGLDLVNAIDDPNFQLMIDFYHLASEHEDPAIVLRARDHIRHLHMANPQGRVFPLKWEEYDYAPFFANLRAIGYDKRISLEGSTSDLAGEGPRAIALLRKAFEY
jgi:D-psicose/D-tagatose/L-ribulose 3-epimerase